MEKDNSTVRNGCSLSSGRIEGEERRSGNKTLVNNQRENFSTKVNINPMCQCRVEKQSPTPHSQRLKYANLS